MPGHCLCGRWKIQQASTVAHARRWFHPSPNHSVEAYHYNWSHECLLSNPSCTPFRGVRMYARSAMGMPGSETALEELMCSALRDRGLIHRSCKTLQPLHHSVENTSLYPHWQQTLCTVLWAAWLALQAECPDLRRTHGHLTQGHALPRSWQTLKM